MSPLPKSIVDSHVHFWEPDEIQIPWMKNTLFDKRMDEVGYAEQVQQVNVQGAVYIEADVHPTYALVEAEWIASRLKQAAEYCRVGAIVAYAPVHHGQYVRGYLTLLRRIAGDRLRGVRFLLQERDPEFIQHHDIALGVRVLEEFNLTFDITIDCHKYPNQFPSLINLVKSCPNVQFILDHMAKPPCDTRPGDPAYEHWKQCITSLSSFGNVACKVSGLVTETQTQTADQLRPFVNHAREAFGVERLMFGGDWPICQSAVPWRKWVDILSEIVIDWSEDDKLKLFVSNATRIYNMD